MNHVYLSPHFPPNYHYFCVHLRRLGVNVLGLADEPYEWLRQDLKEALTEYYRVEDMHSYDQLLRACGYFTHRYGKIDRLDSHTEYWLETEARLRTDFNVEGPKLHDLGLIKRKSAMKEVFLKADVTAPRGALVERLDDIWRLADEVGYPLVAQARRWGGRGQHIQAARPRGRTAVLGRQAGNALSGGGIHSRTDLDVRRPDRSRGQPGLLYLVDL